MKKANFPHLPAFVLLMILSSSAFGFNNIEGNAPKVLYDLIIKNARVLDVHTGKVAPQDVFIKDGRILKIKATNPLSDMTAKKLVRADGKLLVPGFFDLHHHLDLAISANLEVVSQPQLKQTQDTLASLYLTHGVTHLRSAGGKEVNLAMLNTWQNGQAEYPDFYPAGSALTTINTGFYNHIYLQDKTDIQECIQLYYELGIRDLKLYNLMDQESLAVAVELANRLGMRVTGHIDGEMVSIEQGISHGLRQFEHIKTLFINTWRLHQEHFANASLPPDDNQNWLRREFEIFRLTGAENELIGKLVQKLAVSKSAVTPTLSIYAQAVGMLNNTSKNLSPFKPSGWKGQELVRARQGFKQLQLLTLKLHQAGIRLHTGSDNQQPGLTILNEMYQLHQAGISMADVFQIASLNGAKTLQLESISGSISPGRAANFVLFETNPLEAPEALFGPKRVYKQGTEFMVTK